MIGIGWAVAFAVVVFIIGLAVGIFGTVLVASLLASAPMDGRTYTGELPAHLDDR